MIRILLVDDQNLVQEGIKSLLGQDEEFQVIGTVTDGKSAVRQINRLRPDIVLLDIEMPGMNGISVTKYVNHFLPEIKVIILSSHEEKKYVIQALVAGARAYMLKNSVMGDLKQAILAVNNGYSQIESRLLAQVINADRIKYSRSKPAVAKEQNPNQVSNNRQLMQVDKIVRSNRQTSAKTNKISESVRETEIKADDVSDTIPAETFTASDYTNFPNSGFVRSKKTEPVTVSSQVKIGYGADSLTAVSNLSLANDSSDPNKSALVPVHIGTFPQKRVSIRRSSQKLRYKAKVLAISNYLNRVTDRPEIRRIKLRSLELLQPIIKRCSPIFSKYQLRLESILNRYDTGRYLNNIGLMILGGIVVWIIHSL